MKTDLQSRISLAMWVVAAFSTLATAFLFGNLLIRSHRESIRQELQSTATNLTALGISDISNLEDFEEFNSFIKDALQMKRVDKVIRIFDQKKQLIFSTVGLDYDSLPPILDQDVVLPQFRTMTSDHRQYETLALAYKAGKRKRLYYLQVAIPLPRYSEIFETIWWKSVLLVLGLFAGSLLVSRLIVARMLKPVTQIATHLESMDPKRIEAWKPLHFPDSGGRYLDEIVSGVNRLTQRTRSSVLQLRKISRYVAHELRTPLTILRGEAETVLLKLAPQTSDYERVLKSSLEEVQRMSETVNAVLQVGADSGTPTAYRPVPFELKDWLQSHLSVWKKALGRPIHLHLPSTGILRVRNDPKLLFQLVDNFIRNVQRHTPSQTKCAIGLEAKEGTRTIFIEDDGPPMPQEILEAMNRMETVLETDWVGMNLCHTLAEICGLNLRFLGRKGGGLRVEIQIEE